MPDELEQAIILGLFVNANRALVDFAADADDVSADDGWRVAGGQIRGQIAIVGRGGTGSLPRSVAACRRRCLARSPRLAGLRRGSASGGGSRARWLLTRRSSQPSGIGHAQIVLPWF